jgi:putative ABC transport system permease protein
MTAEKAAQVRSRIVVWGLILVLLGLLPGLLLAGGLTRYLGSLLYGVKPLDGITIVAVVTIFLLAGVAASYFPARRGSKVDPIVALRHE